MFLITFDTNKQRGYTTKGQCKKKKGPFIGFSRIYYTTPVVQPTDITK